MNDSVKQKAFIFLTADGTCKDGTGLAVNNNQHIGYGRGHTALDAYNDMLERHVYVGHYDTCFTHELMGSGEVAARFDMIGDTDE